ncbi:MAG TPA: NADH-quinone oxidoreductase subunit A, partial [Microthrixaceae bacterium]|nr:NADH-quinone oxidoreductase subunit A [Microthrixaceae bacterium]
MAQYLPLLVLLILTAAFGGISIVMSRILMPARPTVAKNMPYECGVVDIADPPERFPVRFFLIAMIFVIFDIEIIFYYPFAVIYRELGGYGILAILIFSVAVFESFVYLISNGALDWGPARHSRRSELQLSKLRTSETTIRRVGSEGRGSIAAE